MSPAWFISSPWPSTSPSLHRRLCKALQDKAPKAIGLLRNPYRQAELIGVCFTLSQTDLASRQRCCEMLQNRGFAAVRDKTFQGASEILAEGTVAQVRDALAWEVVATLTLQKGWRPR